MLLVLLATGTSWLIASKRAVALADVERELGNLALVLAEHTDSAFQAVGLVQASVIESVEARGITAAADYERALADQDMHRKLRDKISGLPHIAALNVIGRSGKVINSSRNWPVPDINVADRDYFAPLITTPGLTSLIGGPAKNRATGTWSIYLARKIAAPDGDLLGLVVGAVELEYFEKFFQSIAPGRTSSITLLGTDGRLLARYPRKESVLGQTFLGGVDSLDGGQRGTARVNSQIDGKEQLLFAEKLPHFPLLLTVGLDVSAALEAWSIDARTLAAGALLLALSLVGFTVVIVRRLAKGQKESAQLFAAQRLQLETAVQNMSHGHVLFDRDDRMVVCNERFLDMYGLSPEVVRPGCALLDILKLRQQTGSISRDPQSVGDELAAGMASGKPFTRLTATLDNRIIKITSHAVGTGGWASTHEDITERRKSEGDLIIARNKAREAEQQARDAHARLLAAFEAVPQAMALFDAEDRYVLWNHRYAELCRDIGLELVPGLAFEHMMRGGLAKGMYPEASGREEEWLAERMARHREAYSECERRLTDGRWLRIQERRTPDGGCIAVRTDITELKRRQESFRLLFDANPLPMWLHATDSLRFVAVNDAAVNLYGYSRERFLAMTLLELTPAEDHEELRRLVETPEASYEYGRTWRHHNADGKLIQVGIFARPLQHDGIAASLSAVIDLTEHKQIEQQLHQAQKMEAVGRLSGGMAHDFNNLLLIMIANLDMLEVELQGNPDALEKVQTILGAGLRGAELTRQMLAFSRRQPLQPKRVEVNQLISGTMRMLTRTLGEHIESAVHGAPRLPPILVDEAQLEATLINIAINARDAMPGGGKVIMETGQTEFSADEVRDHPDLVPGRYVVITITDTGSGMAPDVLGKIFEPFFTTKAPGKGTGLGLSMVYGFMKQSGGHITAYSEVGRGTAFKLYLPAVAESQSGWVSTSLPGSLQRGHGELILAVDDNHKVRETVDKQLRELGYRVVTAENADAAIRVLQDGEGIDLLFTDVVMPGGMGGKELAQRAREMHPGLKILFTSGFPGTSLGNGAEFGPDDKLLGKPYRHRDLASKVHEVLHAN